MFPQAEPMKQTEPVQNLLELFLKTADRNAARPATRAKRAGQWQDMTWGELATRARAISDGLAALGVGKGDRVAVLGETTPEWILADLGIMGAGAVTVPIYHSNLPEECRYILDHSGARLVFASHQQAPKILTLRDSLPGLERLIRWGGAGQGGFERSLPELEQLGTEWGASHPSGYAERMAGVNLDDLACILYTSGTTGRPKGVMLTHGNWVYEAAGVTQIGLLSPDDETLNFLPMAHSFAKVIEAAWFTTGGVAAFVESIDKIVDNAGEVKPTIMPSVPRIFEKAFEAAVAKGLSSPGLKGKLFKLAMEGFDAWVAGQERGRSTTSLAFLLGKRIVFPKLARALSARFGGRMRLFISGGAPLSTKIAQFFELLGFTILEGYGLTETSAGTCVNRPGRNRIGTVGPPFPGTEIRIAEDGEIMIRGGGVMKGYYRDPAATAEVLREGWFYTGDIGLLDPAGRLVITDRKKDIIVTAGGKNVAPQNLENELKTDPLISQVMVHGDRRKFLSALITLNEENVRLWAAENGVELNEDLSENPRVRGRIQRSVDALNAREASYSTIKRFAILPRDFSQEAGELTPTLKVKRKFCTQRYGSILDSFYADHP